MEYLENSCSLKSILQNENEELSTNRIKKFSKDICFGLKFCHRNFILHLDIKPSNIIVTTDGVCKLCDFGSSYNIHSGKQYLYEVIFLFMLK